MKINGDLSVVLLPHQSAQFRQVTLCASSSSFTGTKCFFLPHALHRTAVPINVGYTRKFIVLNINLSRN